MSALTTYVREKLIVRSAASFSVGSSDCQTNSRPGQARSAVAQERTAMRMMAASSIAGSAEEIRRGPVFAADVQKS